MRSIVVKYAVWLLLGIAVTSKAYSPNEGVLDFHLGNLKNKSIALDGFWKFYPNQLLTPHDFPTQTQWAYIKIPSWWDASEKIPPIDYGTYRIIVILSKEDAQRNLALKMPDVYSSYALWINGKFTGSNGQVGSTRETSAPQWKPETYLFTAGNDTLEIIVQLANFYHSRSGINNSIYLGDSEKLITQQHQTKTAGTILFISLWVFALVSIGVYYRKKKKDKALIYYACLCIAWSLRSIFSNYYLSVQWFPEINWSVCAKIEYITLYLSTLFGSLLVGRLFPREVNWWFRRIYVVCCSLFTIFTMVTPPSIFTQFVQLYLALSSILLISMLVIITKAYIEDRQGINNLVICIFLAVIMFAYVILSYQGLFELNALVFNGGFFILFLFSGIATVIRLNKMATTLDDDIMTIEHLRKNQHFK